MGKKGSKRKTRWRTLSIGAPPGEEDEEEGLRKDFVKNQDKDANAHTFDRNGQQAGYKPRRTGTTSISGGSTSGYASSGSRSHRDESTGSPSQPKIIFNEDEYTRITTPRQDVLFKKGYLSRKKPWTGNASTSATPSTTESQSASHSTADGSETTEDQQLLDRDSGTGEYPPMTEPGAQLGYGTFYDHASGYYYEYPVMLVGPAPVPAHVGPSVLATVPCGPVPLRPIEWINPAFVPKLANQPYCLMDYQASQSTEPVTIVEEQNGTIAAAEASNNVWNESGTGSASCSGSVAGENEEQAEEADNALMDQHIVKEQLAEEQHPEQQYLEGQQHLENGMTTVDPYLDPLLMQEPVHMPHVIPAVPQPYMYPGHYMFGPPLVNVNGVTIQGGPLVRTMDVAMTMACAKRRKKRKKRKQRRPTLGNTEDEEEGEYSSECENDVSSSRLPWSEGPTSTATTTITTITNRPLNPECQEFQLRPGLQSRIISSPISTSVTTVAEEVVSSVNDTLNDVSSYEVGPVNRETEEIRDIPIVQSLTNQEDATICNSENIVAETPLESIQATTIGHKPKDKNVELNGQTNHLVADVETIVTNETMEVRRRALTDHKALSKTDIAKNNDETTNAKHELLESNRNDVDTDVLNNCVEHSEEILMNGETKHFADSTTKTRSVSFQMNTLNRNSTTDINEGIEKEEEEDQRLQHCNNLSTARTTPFVPTRKYNSKKAAKFVREPTPGPDLNDTMNLELESEKLVQQLMAIDLLDDEHAITNHEYDIVDHKLGETNQRTIEEVAPGIRDNEDNTKTTTQDTTVSSNEDSGFESQTRLSEYPITAAVTEWLRRVNSPDLFITSGSTSDSETDEEEETDAKPPKNLQGNPMPALSANSSVDNVTLLSHAASCGEFAKTNSNNNNNNNTKIDQMENDSTSTSIGRRKRDARGMKRKSKTKKIEKQRYRNVDEKTQSDLVSSLVSCDRLRDFVTAVRLRSTPKHNVGDVCEFTQEDSVAGMRVALSSRINTKRANARRAKTLRRINGNPVENIDIKMRRIDDPSGKGNKETDGDGSTINVRTFEKGEIIVSEDGKLLPTSAYEAVPLNDGQDDDPGATRNAAHDDAINENVEVHEEEEEEEQEEIRNNSENEENVSVMMSSVSIEEPDVLECWEAETVEPVITPKKLLQSPGVLCDGEAAEEDNLEIEQTTVLEHVQKYYRLARDSAMSEEPSELSTSVSISSRSVPNHYERTSSVEHFCSEEIPVFVPDRNRDVVPADEKIPVDEAFEVFESCYAGDSPFVAFDSKMFKQRSLYGQNGEGPVPYRAVCCNIQ